MTQQDIDNAIHSCYWRADMGEDDFAVCRGECLPCKVVIMQGKCNILKELFTKETTNE